MKRSAKLFAATMAMIPLFLLSARDARASVAIDVGSPTAGAVVGRSLFVTVTVTSTFEPTNVHAKVGAVELDLAPAGTNFPGQWTGRLDVSSLPRGAATLVVTVSAGSESGTGTVAFTHDNPPTITVRSPRHSDVARPSMLLDVSCTDDGPDGCDMRITWGQSVVAQAELATGKNAINATVSLAAFEGQPPDKTGIVNNDGVWIVASDGAGQVSTEVRRIYVDSNATLIAAGAVDGDVLDVAPTRILYVRFDSMLVVRDRATSADTVLGPVLVPGVGSFLNPTFDARLTSAGAAWITPVTDCAFGLEAWEWRAGASHELWSTCADGTPAIAGDFFASPTGATITLHDLVTGADTAWTPSPGLSRWRLAPDGSIFGQLATADPSVVRFRGGAVTTLPFTAPGTLLSTDGATLAFESSTPTTSLVSVDTSHVTSLGTLPGPGDTSFVMRHGWSAFDKLSPSGTKQVWTVAPDGTLAQVTSFGLASQHEAIDGAGTWTSTSNAASGGVHSTRRLGTLATSRVVSTELGTAVPRCDGWYVLMGNTAFTIDGAPVPPDECSAPPLGDAGADAAPDGSTNVPEGGDGAPGSDAGTSDGGYPDDAASGSDAGTTADSGGGGGDDGGAGGCAVSPGPSSTAAPASFLSLILLVALRTWRRRRPVPAAR